MWREYRCSPNPTHTESSPILPFLLYLQQPPTHLLSAYHPPPAHPPSAYNPPPARPPSAYNPQPPARPLPTASHPTSVRYAAWGERRTLQKVQRQRMQGETSDIYISTAVATPRKGIQFAVISLADALKGHPIISRSCRLLRLLPAAIFDALSPRFSRMGNEDVIKMRKMEEGR